MRSPRIYCDIALQAGATVRLSDERHHYLAHVLRLGAGDALRLFNGRVEFAGHVVAVERHVSQVRCAQAVPTLPPSPLHITLYLSLAKSRSMDPAIQKATELGAACVQPVQAAYSVVTRGSAQRKLAHWQGIARSACEQCGRCAPLHIAAPMLFDDIAAPEQENVAFVLDPDSAEPLIAAARRVSVSRVVALIGPEGGLSEDEVRKACDKGFVPVSIGPRLLRVETAVSATLSVLQACAGDLTRGV